MENPFGFIEHHFVKNNSFESFEDFHFKLKVFQNEFNNRYHSTIKGNPIELFEKEKAFLIPLPKENIFLPSLFSLRKATSDCLISYNGNRYSVPHYFIGKEVWVKSYKGLKLEVYSQAKKLIATHPIPLNKGNIIIDKSHYKSYSNIQQNSFDSLKHKFLERFCEFNDKELFLDLIKSQKRLNPAYHLKHILSLFEYYDTKDCICVMQECIKYHIFNYHFAKSELQRYSLKTDALSEVKSFAVTSKNVKRSLKEYAYGRNQQS
ncbi:hypothetical protein [Desulfurella sp.]|uniref:Mu transposase domain-containing protein n=1 Tax=Desulfurella sp. TaxID=1962857 RepID=UPI0025C4BAE2|nr:hypothetical protein [Desulfurella sp.]